MRFCSILALATAFSLICSAQDLARRLFPKGEIYTLYQLNSALEPMNREFTDLYNLINDHWQISSLNDLEKREDFQDTLENLLEAFNRSGLLLQIIDQVSQSPLQMDTIVNSIVRSATLYRSNSSSGFNTSAFTLTAKNLTLDLMRTTSQQLLFVDLQLTELANSVGSLLVNQSWIGGVINFMGVHGWITIQKIFEIAQNYKSKDPNFNGTRYHVLKREDSQNSSLSGSLQSFLNNLVGSAAQSEFASASLSSIVGAIEGSGITPSVVQQLLGDQNFYTMIGYISTKLYNYGALDTIDLKSIVKKQQDSGMMAKLLNIALADPIISPRIARIFYQLKNNGAFKQLRLNFLGES